MKTHLRFIFTTILTLTVILTTGCQAPTPQVTPIPLISNTAPAAPAQTPAPQAVSALPASFDFAPYFEGYDGAFVIYSLKTGETLRYRPEQCAKGFLPASTFKILNSLISLETGVIADENTVIPWDGQKRAVEAWNQDLTMRSAIQVSAVWFYQELARRVGAERMQDYLNRVPYGNSDISGQIDSFWLNGGLRISADEQIIFLNRLYLNNLPFSQRSLDIVKDILILEKTDSYILSGKTGSAVTESPVGWFVGYVEKGDDVLFFAANVTGKPDAAAPVAKAAVLKILKDLGVLP
ncbi:MAG TPA: class D beta-lactamase [Anaerolineaceae bacterium]|nr:class D beta-lactamase [Anaerolineaceae bacterium]HPN52802.1 class D beta-lactamase [Anaerolineaceae bacterium]